MPRRRLIASLPLVLALAAPGAARAQGIVKGESKLRHNGIGKVFTGKRLSSRPNLGGGRDLVFKLGRHRLIFSVAQGRVYRISGRAPWVLGQECV
jgi:hypothetical protein